MPPSNANKTCGPHVELASNESTRVTRCPCGTLHVTLLGSGVTVRMKEESMRGVAAGLRGALERIDGEGEDRPALGRAIIN